MTAVEIIRVLKAHHEDVREENFAKIFDSKSIEYLYKVLELENQFNDLSKIKESTLLASEGSQPLSSAVRSSMLYSSSSQVREKDPEKKEIQRRIKQLVTRSIAVCREEEMRKSMAKKKKQTDSEDDYDFYDFEQELNSHSQVEASEKNIPDLSHEEFLNEKELGLEIEKGAVHQEFSMNDYLSKREASVAGQSVIGKMYNLSSYLDKLKREELKRVTDLYSNLPLTLTLLADFMVLLSCLFGKEASQKHVEKWIHQRTREAYHQAAEEKASKKRQANSRLVSDHNGYELNQGLKKTELEEKVEEMNRMVREFFVNLD